MTGTLMPLPSPPLMPDNDQYLSTVHMLDSLVEFYHQECMWVYRTRAALDLACELQQPLAIANVQSELSTSTSTSTPSTELQLHLPRLPAPEEEPDPPEDDVRVKDEPSSPPPLHMVPASTWQRRKSNFKLDLSGVSTHRKVKHHAVGGTVARRDGEGGDARGEILALFERMMESRMESCERVNRLVRRANRAQLHAR